MPCAIKMKRKTSKPICIKMLKIIIVIVQKGGDKMGIGYEAEF